MSDASRHGASKTMGHVPLGRGWQDWGLVHVEWLDRLFDHLHLSDRDYLLCLLWTYAVEISKSAGDCGDQWERDAVREFMEREHMTENGCDASRLRVASMTNAQVAEALRLSEVVDEAAAKKASRLISEAVKAGLISRIKEGRRGRASLYVFRPVLWRDGDGRQWVWDAGSLQGLYYAMTRTLTSWGRNLDERDHSVTAEIARRIGDGEAEPGDGETRSDALRRLRSEVEGEREDEDAGALADTLGDDR